MTEEVNILTKDILSLILPRKIDKKSIDFKNKKCTFIPQHGEDHQTIKNLGLFTSNYLVRIKSSKEQVKTAKDEEFKTFLAKFDIIKNRQLK